MQIALRRQTNIDYEGFFLKKAPFNNVFMRNKLISVFSQEQLFLIENVKFKEFRPEY